MQAGVKSWWLTRQINSTALLSKKNIIHVFKHKQVLSAGLCLSAVVLWPIPASYVFCCSQKKTCFFFLKLNKLKMELTHPEILSWIHSCSAMILLWQSRGGRNQSERRSEYGNVGKVWHIMTAQCAEVCETVFRHAKYLLGLTSECMNLIFFWRFSYQ